VSQVVVTEDKLSSRRQESRIQEHRITQDPRLAKWRMNDISGKDPVAMVLGIAFLPILAAWSGLLAVMMLMLTFLRYLFKGLGMMIGGSKSLITK
jgi:hypothetical protein